MPLIYCVEDDENIRELVGYALRSQDFEVETFSDSKEFWPALEKRTPALLLLDIMLPGESGNDILDKLRKTQQYKTLPVIMLTAKTSEYDIVRGLDGGADDYVCKPFGIVELISRMPRRPAPFGPAEYGKRTSIRMGPRFPWTRKNIS